MLASVSSFLESGTAEPRNLGTYAVLSNGSPHQSEAGFEEAWQGDRQPADNAYLADESL